DACNLAHRARAIGDAAMHERARVAIADLLEQYDATDGDGHAHPAWARPNQRAMAQSALGDIEAAVRTEAVALRYADTPRRVVVSAGNIADRLIRLDRADEAIDYIVRAWNAAPTSVPVMITAARAFYLTGQPAESEAIFAELAEIASLHGPDSDLAAALRHEHGLSEMAAECPSLRSLFDWLDAVEAGS
ncbi:MAG: hypothetical protein AAGB48_11845, partial [Planctomycetota bacterium]